MDFSTQILCRCKISSTPTPLNLSLPHISLPTIME